MKPLRTEGQGLMPSLTELSTAQLRDAGDAVETLIDFRGYLLPGGMLLMLAGKFRDDIRELLGMPPLERVSRGQERKKYDSMKDAEVDRLGKAVAILNSVFAPYMDDADEWQYMGCAGRVANGINTVHLSYVREKTGHALIGARQWIPAEHIADPVKSLVAALPPDLRFRTKGQLAIDIMKDACADGLAFDFACEDEVYGSCTELRQFLEDRGQAYVLRVASSFTFALARGTSMTCKEAVKKLLKGKRAWEIRSAGQGSKGERWYAWAWIATSSPRRSLLVRRHLKTGELAFHYCFVPESQPASKARLIRAAGLRWPVEESFELAKGCFGLEQCQARLYTAVLRHLVLVMAALAVCAVTAAQLRERTDTQAPPPAGPDDKPPADPGLLPLSVHEIKRLLAAALRHPEPPGNAARWLRWRRRHQARSCWFHKRARLARNYALVS